MTDECYTSSPLYISGISGEPLTLRTSRISVVSKDDFIRKKHFNGEIVPANLKNKKILMAIENINYFYWESLEQDVFSKTYKILECENYVAVPEDPSEGKDKDGLPDTGGIAGHMALLPEDGFLHIVVFHVWPQWHRRGVGYMLIVRAIEEARERGFETIRLATTNDNIPAFYFYQRMGFEIENILVHQMLESDGSVMKGFAGIPVRDEIQMKLNIQ